MAKLDPEEVVCSAMNCSARATILHRQRPYCGRHALELIERGETLDARADYETSSAGRTEAPPEAPQEQRNEQAEFESKPSRLQRLTQIGNRKKESDKRQQKDGDRDP